MPHCSQQDYRTFEAQRRLLYVGNDLALLKSLRTTFSKPEHHIVSCPDRLSAEMFIKSQIQYQLFIFDIEMRDKASLDLTQLVRSLEHRESLPSLVVGPEAEASRKEFTHKSRVHEYAQKEDHFLAIQKAIKRLLERSSKSLSTRLGSGTALPS